MNNLSPTKQLIVDCATLLLQERGYHGWSYEDISKVVGLRKATLHYHFPKKEDLVKELIILYRKKSIDFLESYENKGIDPKDKLLNIVKLFSAVPENPKLFCLCGMLAADLLTISDEIKNELSIYFTDIEKYTEAVFAEGEKQKLWSCQTSPLFEAKSLIASFEGMLLLSRLNGGESHFVKMALTYLSRIINVV